MDFKCVSVINQMLFNESKTARRDKARHHLSLRNQIVIIITCGVFFCVPDLLIILLHLFLFLTQRISGRFPLMKKAKKKTTKEKTPKNHHHQKSFFLDSKIYNANKNIGLSVYFLQRSYLFLHKK